ncbi:hypothetical protein J2Z48_001711 [Croceifilum oryzae]|uniref:Uncharacterized protein n=1 Tax=Croceifilum oryzae TaxID=1553429 RepID=A0AAJ1WT07_9BACL|nr:hypothetical protein [Croceifilum oryzae]MDQ0417538.1 hypothetical protein [Croceifilum oryzae]
MQEQFVGVFIKFLKDSNDANAKELASADSKFQNAIEQQGKSADQFNESWKKFVENAGAKFKEESK